ncbi:NAD(P)H-dependent flavin oxidoreductase [Fluviicola chungangensis]|uniref:Propionate 3-nitronate monooxygenase n=1 Tax=Fluviicola chungangensis TaxID=2597671 RepID=A0A556MJN9_9FLAO|nr:nitronate monooxygenase [Fluviicola chungangensis]TSJ40089.1 nitronate monooxygenase [Fluviicola chungangensis]
MWYKTKATELMGIDYPILQGPFGGGLSTPELVATVSNTGGLGGYGAYSISPQEIYDMDQRIKALTDKPYNLNLWVSDTDAKDGTVSDEAFEQTKAVFKPYFDEAGLELPAKPDFKTRFENQVQVILDVRPRVFSFVFGIPSPFILEEARKRGILLVGNATTLDEAIALENAGVDAIVASGFEAGGHRPSFLEPAELSTTGSFVLTQLVREKVKLPVIAAGGIASGKGIAAAFTLGADAVQIGTAFLATEESGALPAHREALFSDAAKQTLLTRSYTGRLGRGISNRLAKETSGKEVQILPFPLQTAFMSSLRKAALAQNKYDLVLFWSGQIAPVLKHRKAEELMHALIEETGKLMGS